MIWATVTILTPCSRENFSRSGTRAIVPSSFMISHMTPAGFRPARRARSTAASVWPARCRTPPGRARSGKTCPGWTTASGPFVGSIGGRDARRDAFARLDRDRERGLQRGLVVVGHRFEAELVAALLAEAETN